MGSSTIAWYNHGVNIQTVDELKQYYEKSNVQWYSKHWLVQFILQP